MRKKTRRKLIRVVQWTIFVLMFCLGAVGMEKALVTYDHWRHPHVITDRITFKIAKVDYDAKVVYLSTETGVGAMIRLFKNTPLEAIQRLVIGDEFTVDVYDGKFDSDAVEHILYQKMRG